MNDLCVILAATAIAGSGLGTGGAGAHELYSERVIFADPFRALESADGSSVTQRLAFPAEINDGKVGNYGGITRDRPMDPVTIDGQYVRKPFMWPWASSPAQNNPTGETPRSHRDRNGGNAGGRSGRSGASGSGNSDGGSQSGSGNMGGGNSSGGGNMGGGSSGGSEGGGMN
jgi:hypothetical protein